MVNLAALSNGRHYFTVRWDRQVDRPECRASAEVDFLGREEQRAVLYYPAERPRWVPKKLEELPGALFCQVELRER